MRVRRMASALVLLGIVVASALALPGLVVHSEITHFLPKAGDHELARIARDVARSAANQTVSLTVEAPSSAKAVAAGRALGDALKNVRGVAWVHRGPTPEFERSFYQTYFDKRLLFAGPSPGDVAESFEPGSLRARARSLRRELSGPAGAFVRELAQADPWMFFSRHLDRLREAQPESIRHRLGQFVTGSRDQYAVLFLGTRASAFNTQAGRQVQAGIHEAFVRVNKSHGGALRLEQAGIHRLAIASESSIRSDIARVSTVGVCATLVLILLVFRSWRFVFIAALPIASGMLVATAVTGWWFGSIHGLTFAFGATLIGVAIDYVAHLLNHHVLDPRALDRRSTDGAQAGPYRTLRRIAPGLALGAATTLVGLSGLSWTSFPGIAEMSLYTSVGVAVAFLVTTLVLPNFIPSRAPTSFHRTLERQCGHFLVSLGRQRWVGWGILAFAVALSGWGVWQVRWEDDLRSFQGIDQTLLDEEARVRARVSGDDAGRLVVARGRTVQEVLERNDSVHRVLRDAKAQGVLKGFRSLHDLVPSARHQQQILRAIPSDAWQRSSRALAAEGFRPEAFVEFERALREPTDAVHLRDIRHTALERLVEPFVVQVPAATKPAGAQPSWGKKKPDSKEVLDSRDTMVLSMVQGVRDPARLSRAVNALKGVRLFEQTKFLQSAYRGFRVRTVEMVLGGLVLVLLLVVVRYRSLPAALAAFLPAVLAAGCTIGLLTLLGQRVSLLHVVALLLVLSMGVDYGVFLVEARRDSSGASVTCVGLLFACLSTVASFGVLSLSDNPGLHAIGMTATLGVVLSLLFAPTAWVLLRPASESLMGPG